MHSITNTELSSLEGTRCPFNGGKCTIKLGIDVHQDFYVVVEQVGGTNPKPPQRFHKQAFLHWAAKLKQSGADALARCPGGIGLAPGSLPAQLQASRQMAADPGQRGTSHRSGPQKAIVAVARQLAVDLWRIKTGRLTAEQLGLTI
jgi:hypothetical protein